MLGLLGDTALALQPAQVSSSLNLQPRDNKLDDRYLSLPPPAIGSRHPHRARRRARRYAHQRPSGGSRFESPYYAVSGNNGQISGSIANGWSDNSTWSDSTVQYSQEFSNPHSGASCQKMAVASIGSGEAQFQQGIPVVAGSLYTASVWMRGDAGTQVILRIQDASAPYESYLDTYATLTANWQQIVIQGYIVVSTGAHFMIALSAPGTVWIDDASLSYVAGTAPPTPNAGPIPTSFFGIHVANFLGERSVEPRV